MLGEYNHVSNEYEIRIKNFTIKVMIYLVTIIFLILFSLLANNFFIPTLSRFVSEIDEDILAALNKLMNLYELRQLNHIWIILSILELYIVVNYP